MILVDVVGWFADAGNWTGSDGMLLRLGEHLWITVRVVVVPSSRWAKKSGPTGLRGHCAIQ